MDWLTPVALSLGTIAVVVALGALGWRSRLGRQRDIPAPAEAPEVLSEPLYIANGQYVVTTTAGDWLDRIAVHGLGVKSNATATVHEEGILIVRSGARDLFIRRSDLTSVRLDRGMAGKFVEKDGLVVFTWTLNGTAVDTGFRTRQAEARTGLLHAASDLAPTDPRQAADRRTPSQTQNPPKDTQ
ncbi:PH-like domain-containing protein [Arthrobacter sp. CAN_A1]|uniref:PH-like domain-containing protein n=1 Tax=Arthrobacter sp. CAN_A1 TaxID=2787717 RepID=UPI0018C8F4AE